MGIVIIGGGGSLGLVQRPLLFLSANVESIFTVAMETIVFVWWQRLVLPAEQDSAIFVMSQHLINAHTHTQVNMPEYR